MTSMDAATPPSVRDSLARLYARTDLTKAEARELFEALIGGAMGDIEIGALLVALRMKGETPEEIGGAAEALRAAARPFVRPETPFADLVGTGGDGAHTLNVSTLAALVAAEAGLPVAKHGNRSVSSQCGAADLLERFGLPLDASPEEARLRLDRHRFTFLFAPHYHPGIRHAMPARKALATRTIFNLLGPLVNPAHPPIMLLGVYDAALCHPVAEALRLLGTERALVVHGSGLDEIAPHGPTQAVRLSGGTLEPLTLAPSDFGAPERPLAELVGGLPEENARLARAVLEGQGAEAHQEAVALNAGALLHIAEQAASFAAGYLAARDILATDRAWRRLQACVQPLEETV